MVLLHDSEKEIGLKSAIEGMIYFISNSHPILDVIYSDWYLLLND